MARIDPTIFNTPPADLWNQVNSLGLTYLQFAHATHYHSRLYGVLTDKEEGLKHRDDVTTLRSFVVNNCVRDALYRLLFSIQESTEKRAGFNTAVRYHYEEQDFPYYGKWQTHWPGVATMNVRPAWTTIESLEEVELDPYIERAITVVGSPPIASITRLLSPNPKDVFLRNEATGAAYTIDEGVSPLRDGANWKLQLANNVTAWNNTDVVGVQNKGLMKVTVTVPTLPTGATLHAVYPGTNQIIPYARDPVDAGGGETTFFFYPYTLIDPAFYLEEPAADLVKGEFYKFLEFIQFKYVTEVATPFEVVWGADTNEFVYTLPDDPVETRIVDPAEGVVQTQYGSDLFSWEKFHQIYPGAGCFSDHIPRQTVKLRYWYKTDPMKLREVLYKQIDSIREAMLYRVAAELPMKDCGCDVDLGFIAAQQEMVATVTVNTVLKIEEHQFRYGQLLGQQRYEAVMKSVLTHQRLVRF
jgi:hypothetical protein